MKQSWWKEGVIYQIYPQSFYDSNGDGIGDLRGILEKLDYIQGLGVDIIWLNPIYDSPLDDNGYDIRDYRKINPIYGTMADFDELLNEMHSRGLRLLMDLVVNHSSDEHAWFRESRKSKDNPYRDYYFWRPGKNGGPPNNWPAFFGGSAWDLDPLTGEYYLHYFSKKQPDLNWENPEVRQSIFDIVRWWLEKGIDGFRLDVIPMISKYLDFPDHDTDSFEELIEKYYCNGPRVHEFIREMHDAVLKDYDVMTVGEGPGITRDKGNLYTGKDRRELSMIFPLDLMFADWGSGGKFDPGTTSVLDLKTYFRKWDQAIGDDGWVSVFLDNHDFPRMVSRFGNDDRFRDESAKLLLTMLLTLRGSPSIYFGSEIGMRNVPFAGIKEYRDLETLNFYQEAISKGMAEEEVLRRIAPVARDNVRTPMQWSDQPQGGFTRGTPWIKVSEDSRTINVANEKARDDGILAFFRSLIDYRKHAKTFVYGTFEDLDPDHPSVFHYDRKDDAWRFKVILNLSDEQETYTTPDKEPDIHNYPAPWTAQLRPWEARIYRMES